MPRVCQLLAVALLFCACAVAIDVYTVQVVAGIGNAKKVVGDDAGFKWIQYCSATADWNCNNEPGLCTRNCGTENANGPQCLCPQVPGGRTLDLGNFPVQIRWGDPVPSDVPGSGTGVKSGFGFKPIVTQTVPATTSEFLVGTAVHFNQPIWSSGSSCGGWDLKIQIKITPASGGQQISGNFVYSLQLDETNNNCTRFWGKTGCWDNSFWASNPTALEWPSCNEDAEGLPRSPDNNYCCRYKTTNNIACADKVWTLNTLDLSAPPIIIDGVQYTLWLNGFSVPGQPGVRKSFFISQETLNTQADIYGRLVKACPPAGQCPVAPVLSPDGTACVCPITLPPPPTTKPPTTKPPTTNPPATTTVPPADTVTTGLTLPPPVTEPPVPTEPPTEPPVPTEPPTEPPVTETAGVLTLPPNTETAAPTETVNTTVGAQARSPSRNQMSKAAVAGIVVGSLVAAGILAAAVVFFIVKGAANAGPLNTLLGAGEVGVANDNPLWNSATIETSNPAYNAM